MLVHDQHEKGTEGISHSEWISVKIDHSLYVMGDLYNIVLASWYALTNELVMITSHQTLALELC